MPMEQKLAEFRARRQTEKAVKISETDGLRCQEDTGAETGVQSDRSQEPHKTENKETAPHGSQNQVRKHIKHTERRSSLNENC